MDDRSAVWDERQLRLGVKAAGVALWTWNVETDHLTMDNIGHSLWGVPAGSAITFEDLSAKIHPADRDRVRAAFSATRGIIGPYETDFRILLGAGFQHAAAATTRASSARSCMAFSRT